MVDMNFQNVAPNSHQELGCDGFYTFLTARLCQPCHDQTAKLMLACAHYIKPVGKGRTVDFKNTILIMTSNLGSQLIMELGENNREDMRRKIDELLHLQFKPEFLNIEKFAL